MSDSDHRSFEILMRQDTTEESLRVRDGAISVTTRGTATTARRCDARGAVIWREGAPLQEQSAITLPPLPTAPRPIQVNPREGKVPGHLLYLPHAYTDADRTFPLVIFLHGAGERGDGIADLDKVRRHGPVRLLDAGSRLFDRTPCIVVAPQNQAFDWSPASLVDFIHHLQAHYRVDPARILVTGLSTGGAGTWNLAVHAPELLAAIAPCCSTGGPRTAERLRDQPVWAAHAWDDPVVPRARTLDWLLALAQVEDPTAGPPLSAAPPGSCTVAWRDGWQVAEGIAAPADARWLVTLTPDRTHDCWTTLYADADFWAWFLTQHRP